MSYDTVLDVNVGYAKHGMSIDEYWEALARVPWAPTNVEDWEGWPSCLAAPIRTSGRSTKSREYLFGSRLPGAEMHAQTTRKKATAAAQEADHAAAAAWSIRMAGFGGPAQPSPTLQPCIDGGLGWLEVECRRCRTRASLPLQDIRRPRDSFATLSILRNAAISAARAAGEADRPARDHALSMGSPR
jgi:hypothetical protein